MRRLGDLAGVPVYASAAVPPGVAVILPPGESLLAPSRAQVVELVAEATQGRERHAD